MMQKNPWMSLWLSGVNAWSGAARGFWMAEMHRQHAAIATETAQQIIRFWMAVWMMPTPHGTKRRRR